MAEKPQKKKFAPVIAADDSTQEQPEQVVQSGEPTAQVDAQPAAESTSKGSRPAVESTPEAPYSEYGGLAQTLSQRKETASRRREEAAQEWERRLSEQSNARLALVNAVKPENTSRKQRSLRNQAIGQAAGELIGALFGGIYGLGKQGRGYVPKMPGLYRNTLAKMQQLEDNDIAAQQKFRGMLGGVQERNAADRVAMAQDQYRDAVAEEKQIRTEEYYADREAFRAGNRYGLAESQAIWRRTQNADNIEARKETEEYKHANKLELIGIKEAYKKAGVTISDSLSITMSKLRKKRGAKIIKSSSVNADGDVSTTERESFTLDKTDQNILLADSRIIDSAVSQFDISHDAAINLFEALRKYNGSVRLTWDDVLDDLRDGYQPGAIISGIERINTNGNIKR